MAINTVGFDKDPEGNDVDITEGGFAKLMRAVGLIGYEHGVLSGLTTSAAAGTRTVTVTNSLWSGGGGGIAPGVWFESTTSVSRSFDANAGSSNRVDYVVMRLDWTENTGEIAVVKGSSATAPALTQTEGGVWEVPLARVTIRPGVTTLLGSDVVVCKPLVRKVYPFEGSAIATHTIAYSASAYTISSVNVTDPGWPYRLQVVGAAKFDKTGGGYGDLSAWVGGSQVEVGRSARLDNEGPMPAHVDTTTDVLSGPTSVALRMAPAFMSSGSSLTVVSGTNCWLTVLQIPA